MSGHSTYIIECKELACVKIGRARDPEKRMQKLQTGCPSALELYATFNADIESDLHIVFSDKRKRGEWFNACPWNVQRVAKCLIERGVFPDLRAPGEWGICAIDWPFGFDLISMGDAKAFIRDRPIRSFSIKWVDVDEYLKIYQKTHEEKRQIAMKMLGGKEESCFDY